MFTQCNRTVSWWLFRRVPSVHVLQTMLRHVTDVNPFIKTKQQQKRHNKKLSKRWSSLVSRQQLDFYATMRSSFWDRFKIHNSSCYFFALWFLNINFTSFIFLLSFYWFAWFYSLICSSSCLFIFCNFSLICGGRWSYGTHLEHNIT